MSQTQPTIEKIHSLRKKTRDSVKKSYPYRLSRRHLFLIIALHRHATKIYAGYSRRCEIHRYGTRYFVYYLYHNTYRLSYQNENASLGNTCGRTRLTLTEPPRLYRRVIYLSQAAMPDRVKLS